MKLFECQHCGQLLYFENTRCESCERRLGYLPSRETVTAVEPKGDVWRALAEPVGPPGEKSPERSGPFKRAFDNGFLLVYGTQGNSFESSSLLERARADAAEWWYRGNGCAPLLSDDEYLELAAAPEFAGRNVILYGNTDSNSAFAAVLPANCPVQAHRGRIDDVRRVGQRAEQVTVADDARAVDQV